MNRVLSSRKNKFDAVFDIVVNALLIIITIIVIYPLYFIVIASVSDPNAVNAGEVLLFPRGFSMECYTRILQESKIWTGYKNTIIYTVFGTLFGLAATLMAGYSLSRRDLSGRNLVMKLLVFTMFFSGGLIPTYLVVKGLHITNTPYVMIILGSISVFNIIITKTFFESTIPHEFLEAAFIDGCSNGTFFVKIVLPISKSIVAVIALYYAVHHWNAFFNALIYLSEEKLYPLQLILRDILIGSQMLSISMEADPSALEQAQRIAESIKYGVIIVSSLPVLIAYPFLQKYFVKGVMIGGIKG